MYSTSVLLERNAIKYYFFKLTAVNAFNHSGGVLPPQRLRRKFRTYLTVKESADSRGRVYGSINVEAKRTGRRLAMQVNNPLLSVQASKSAADGEGILNPRFERRNQLFCFNSTI